MLMHYVLCISYTWVLGCVSPFLYAVLSQYSKLYLYPVQILRSPSHTELNNDTLNMCFYFQVRVLYNEVTTVFPLICMYTDFR